MRQKDCHQGSTKGVWEHNFPHLCRLKKQKTSKMLMEDEGHTSAAVAMQMLMILSIMHSMHIVHCLQLWPR